MRLDVNQLSSAVRLALSLGAVATAGSVTAVAGHRQYQRPVPRTTQASGQLVYIDGAPNVNPSTMRAVPLGPFDDRFAPPDSDQPFTGHFRNPLPLSDGNMLAVHTFAPGTGSSIVNYDFHIKALHSAANNTLEAGNALIAPISKSVSFFDGGADQVKYNGVFWELSPVEVRARSAPPTTSFALKAPDEQAFADTSVDLQAFQRIFGQTASRSLLCGT
jgi:hypothetical protein